MNPIPMRAAQVALGAVGVYAGYKVGSGVVRSAFREDLVGSPSRIVEIDDKWIVDQPRAPQGPGLSKLMMGAGAATAFIGAGLALGGAPATNSIRSMVGAGGGAALFALGTGLVVGSISMAMQYRGADVRPAR